MTFQYRTYTQAEAAQMEDAILAAMDRGVGIAPAPNPTERLSSETLAERRVEIINFIAKHGASTSRQVSEGIGVPDTKTRNDLKRLHKFGMLDAEWSRSHRNQRQYVYSIAKEAT